MYQGDRYNKRKKRYDNRPPYSKPIYKRKEYLCEYTTKVIEVPVPDYKKPCTARQNRQFEGNKENESNNINVNTSFPIFNLTSDMVDDAYFVPKKVKSMKTVEFNIHSSDQELIKGLNNMEETRSFNSMSNTCEESYSNYDNSTPENKRKLSGKSTSGSYPLTSEFITDDFQSNAFPLVRMASDNNIEHQQYLPPLTGNTKLVNTSDSIIKKSSSMNLSYNKFNSFTKFPQSMQSSNDEDNIEILSVNVKVSEKEVLIFKLKRFDDLFKTVKLFCEINKIEEKLIKPLIIKSLETLNQIYQVINYPIENEDKCFLESIKLQCVA